MLLFQKYFSLRLDNFALHFVFDDKKYRYVLSDKQYDEIKNNLIYIEKISFNKKSSL